MRAVSNTSPVSNLLQIGAVDLLFQIFDELWIPPAVESELRRFHSWLPSELRTQSPSDSARVARLSEFLDAGEAQAIVLAHELKADWLIMDEKLGRRTARVGNLPVTGVAGVLLKAKRRGLIAEVLPYLDRLENVAGFYLGKDVKASILEKAGEPPA